MALLLAESNPDFQGVGKPENWLDGEGPFQLSLDADLSCWSLYLTFADWLEERGDWRAPGYRWMGENRKRPSTGPDLGRVCWNVVDGPDEDLGELELPIRFSGILVQACRYCTSVVFPVPDQKRFVFYFWSFQHARDSLCLALRT
jgi:hypothetical protein